MYQASMSPTSKPVTPYWVPSWSSSVKVKVTRKGSPTPSWASVVMVREVAGLGVGVPRCSEDQAPKPASFLACTRTRYSVSFARLGMVYCRSVAVAWREELKDSPPDFHWTRYSVGDLPPSSGTLHVTSRDSSRDSTVTSGAPGSSLGLAVTSAAAPSPVALRARTWKVYSCPLVRPDSM